MNLIQFLDDHKEVLGDALLRTPIAALGLGVNAEFVFSVTPHTPLLSVRSYRKNTKRTNTFTRAHVHKHTQEHRPPSS